MIRKALRTAVGVGMALALTVVPASADETSSLTIDATDVSNGFVTVAGTAMLGDDLLGPVEVWTDGEGDASLTGAGFDLTSGSIATDLAAKRLVFTLSTADGVGALGGSPPASGFEWPINVDGEDWFRWLGAGGPGSDNSTTKFTALCENENEAEGGSGGWSCATRIPGEVTQEGVTWQLPFFRMKPVIDVGSTVDGGGILCGVPCSMAWPPGLVGALAPVDTGGFPDTYVVPGEMKLGIASAGFPESQVEYEGTASLDSSATGFTGAIAAPTTAGDYTVWVKTCGGLQRSLTCVIGSVPLTIS